MKIINDIISLLGSADYRWFFICLVISILILVVSGIISFRKAFDHSHKDMAEVLQVFSLCLLFAATVMFLPVYYLKYQFEDNNVIIRPFLLSIHNAMRLFVLDGEFDFIRDNISFLPDTFRTVFSFYAVFLYVFTPVIFTFTIFLSILRNMLTRIVLMFYRRSPLYIFSCLNEESAAMAESILSTESEGKKQRKRLILFCDIPTDKKAELTTMVPDRFSNHVLVLSTAKDITDFPTNHFLDEITFFLMARDEADNIRKASGLCDCLIDQAADQKRDTAEPPARRILVYASSPAYGLLVDALSQKVSVSNTAVKRIREIINDACSSAQQTNGQPDLFDITEKIRKGIGSEEIRFFTPFSIQRIVSKEQLAIRIAEEIYTAAGLGKSGDITVTLLGMGGIGKEILSAILWLYQQYGRRLIINVFDAAEQKPGSDPDSACNPLYDRLTCEWPELMETNSRWQKTGHPDTEAEYDIHFFLGIDCFSSRFTGQFDKQDVGDRLLQSSLVICALGDDDKNLEAALMMRQLFSQKTGSSDSPYIYAVVYDNQKAENFSAAAQLKNYKDTPFNISVGGSMQSQYSFSNIKKTDETGQQALVYHINWIWTSCEAENGQQTDASDWMKMSEDQKSEFITKELGHYIHYEHYRRASVAKAVHKDFHSGNQISSPDLISRTKDHDPSNPDCGCPICRARITEHMRWNAFMRVNGYRYGTKKNDMGKIHPCLQPWNTLPFEERVKD